MATNKICCAATALFLFFTASAAETGLSLAPRKAEQTELSDIEKYGICIQRGELPVDWSLRLQEKRKHSGAVLNVVSSAEKKSILLNFPDNTSNDIQLISKKSFSDSGRHLSFRARGNGTIHLCFQADTGAKQHPLGSYLVNSDQWHTFRTDAVKSHSGKYHLLCSVYGKIEVSNMKFETLPAVDPGAELVFYAPFERGSANAVISTGNTTPVGAVDFEAVPGVCGQAIRISRTRRLQKNGLIRYPIGFGYEFLKNVISADSGTIEFYFRPLPEMLEKQQWGGFPLFYLGDTSWQWPNSHDFDLMLNFRKGKLLLTLNEHARAHLFPTNAPCPPQGRSASFTIHDPQKFVSVWHHLAFCYDENQRQIFLDGKPVITCKALKKPAVSSRIPQLLFANGHCGHPALMSSDLDELKIYRQVKYHGSFVPVHASEKFIPNPSGQKTETVKSSFKLGKPETRNHGKTVAVPLQHGNNRYEILISFANGYPLVLNPKGNLTGIRVENEPDLLQMVMEKLSLSDTKISGSFAKYCTDFHWTFQERNGIISATLELDRKGGFWHAYLEPSIAIHCISGPFAFAYDGWSTRQILKPFIPFSFDGVMTALPMCAAWNGRDGVCIALTPETLCGELRRGMNAEDTIFLKLRTAMKTSGKGKFSFEIAPFNSDYNEGEAIDAWHERHPDYFAYNPDFDKHCYGNLAQGLPWNNDSFRERSANFSYPEIARRCRAGWVWFYESGPSVGNWSANRELLDELPPVNIPYGGDYRQNTRWNDIRQKKINDFADADVAAAPYISSWSERRTAGLFSDSLIDENEAYNGIVSWPNYWKRGVVDQIMMPKYTSYGTFLRHHIDALLQRHPEVNLFSYDLCGYDYRFRKANSAGWLNAFDERGAYLPHVTALGSLLEDLRHVTTRDGYRVTVTGNVDVSRASFNTSCRISCTVHEQNYIETTQNWGKLRQQTRLHGERPTVFLPMPPLDGNFFGNEDPRLLRYSAVWLHQSHILLGALFNIRQNNEIFGVKESVDALDPLLRLQKLGYRQSPRAHITGGLALARYGKAEQGAWAAVNLHPDTRTGILTIDQKMFHRTLLPAIDGRSIEITPANQIECKLPPLSFLTVETLGSAPAGQEIHCTSTLKREPHCTRWKITFHKDTTLSDWHINKTFQLENGRQLPNHVTKGETLSFVSSDKRWHCTPEQLQETVQKFGNKVIIAGPSTKEWNRAGRRIVEFFRFGTIVNGKKCQASFGKNGNILLQTGNTESLIIQDGKVVITSRPDQIRQMTNLFLKNLEKLYPYYGVFGTQQPVKALDWAATGMQKEFLKRSKIVSELRSTSKASAEFRQYLQEKKLDPYKKF